MNESERSGTDVSFQFPLPYAVYLWQKGHGVKEIGPLKEASFPSPFPSAKGSSSVRRCRVRKDRPCHYGRRLRA